MFDLFKKEQPSQAPAEATGSAAQPGQSSEPHVPNAAPAAQPEVTSPMPSIGESHPDSAVPATQVVSTEPHIDTLTPSIGATPSEPSFGIGNTGGEEHKESEHTEAVGASSADSHATESAASASLPPLGGVEIPAPGHEEHKEESGSSIADQLDKLNMATDHAPEPTLGGGSGGSTEHTQEEVHHEEQESENEAAIAVLQKIADDALEAIGKLKKPTQLGSPTGMGLGVSSPLGGMTSEEPKESSVTSPLGSHDSSEGIGGGSTPTGGAPTI